MSDPSKIQIYIGRATCGDAAGAGATQARIEKYLAEHAIDAEIHTTGCLGFCYAEPLVDIIKPGKTRVTFCKITAEEVDRLLDDYLVNNVIPEDLVLGASDSNDLGVPVLSEHPFMKHQVRLALRNCGIIDPTDINEYQIGRAHV